MSQEQSADISFKRSETAAIDETTLTRARYDQSHPAKSRRGSTGVKPNLLAPSQYLGEHTMDPSHATSSIGDGGESTYSYDSARDLSEYFRQINGRRFSSQNSVYMLPADETEFWRLDKQHAAWLVGLGGLYPCPDLVERVLAPRPEETIEMVDLGCGTGTWALSMARKFPHVQVLGVDLAPVPLNPELLTPNISFEIDDINLGLAHHAGRFDLVHMRCATGGLSDYAAAITIAAKCLKPGGLLLLVEFEGIFCAEDMVSAQKMATPNQPDGSWIQRFCYEFRWAYARHGVPMWDKILDKGLWGHPLLEGCGAAAAHIPVGPWAKATDPEEAQRLQFSGIILRQNMRSILYATQTMMKNNGVSQNLLDEWAQKCEKELDDLKIHNWAYLRLVWGQRKYPDATSSTSEGPTNHRPPQLQLSTWTPHQQIRIYNTLEECQAARKKRLDAFGEMVEPAAVANT